MAIGLLGRKAHDMQPNAARRHEALRAFIDEIAIDQRIGHEALQVLRRLALHAGGDFFAEQFEEKVGHQKVSKRRGCAPLPQIRWRRGARNLRLE